MDAIVIICVGIFVAMAYVGLWAIFQPGADDWHVDPQDWERIGLTWRKK